jgi:3-dehydroquinate synthase
MLADVMIEIPVELGERRYSVCIGHGLVELVPDLLGQFKGRRIVVVSGQRVWKLYGNRIGRALRKVGRVEPIVVPDGERYKSRNTLSTLHDRFLEAGLARDGLVVAVGGGVVGDLTGLAAATYMRESTGSRSPPPCFRWWTVPSAGRWASTIRWPRT